MTAAIDISGQRFGRLVAIEPTGERRRSDRVWRCVCDCGQEHNTTVARLRGADVRSCGCLARMKHLQFDVGARYGLLTIVARKHNDAGRPVCVCRCDCGGSCEVHRGQLVKGMKKSCGCLRAKRELWTRVSDRERAAHATRSHTRRARQRAIGGSFTQEEVVRLYDVQRGRCANPNCRAKLGLAFHRDHIVPLAKRGENRIRNIQLLCPPCNQAKGAKMPEVWARENGRLI